MRVVFMGTGEISIPSLHWLLSGESSIEVVGVFTQPDKKVGRKQILTPPEVKVIAESKGIPVFQPESFRKDPDALSSLEKLEPDIAVVMAYGQILPKSVIAAPRLGCVNLHASLLPRHRGASPIQAAIREGDEESGITLMHIAPALDAGDMILKKSLPILAEDTGESLHDRLADLGPAVLAEGIPAIIDGSASREVQDDAAVTYSGKLMREDGEIDWSLPAEKIERLIRAYDPWPGTFTVLSGGEGEKKQKVKIYPHGSPGPDTDADPGAVLSSDKTILVACGEGTSLSLEGELQMEGRKRLSVGDFLRGNSIEAGTKLGL